MQHIYQEIADTVNQMIPEDCEKFFFYVQITALGGGTYFFYNTLESPNLYQYNYEIPFEFKINELEFDRLDNYLFDLSNNIRNIFKKYDQKLWYSFTMSL